MGGSEEPALLDPKVLRDLHEAGRLIEGISELVPTFEQLLGRVRAHIDSREDLGALGAAGAELDQLCGHAGAWGFAEFKAVCLQLRLAADLGDYEKCLQCFVALADAHQRLILGLVTSVQEIGAAYADDEEAAAEEGAADAKVEADVAHLREEVYENLKLKNELLAERLTELETAVARGAAEAGALVVDGDDGSGAGGPGAKAFEGALADAARELDAARTAAAVAEGSRAGEGVLAAGGTDQEQALLDEELLSALYAAGRLADDLVELLPWLDAELLCVKRSIDSLLLDDLAASGGSAQQICDRVGALGLAALARSALRLRAAARVGDGPACGERFSELAATHQATTSALAAFLSRSEAEAEAAAAKAQHRKDASRRQNWRAYGAPAQKASASSPRDEGSHEET
eukprot:TRINITY_DN22914_c0_g1_i1.p1 TRINITY_DN22914_c0_g1~~TRINITY_DN22914_c0_g1_i1.p1  ORF type:complete len:411 (-),score=128.47 TRINITY_DN22914_c0_g1_i1:380-1591(-)